MFSQAEELKKKIPNEVCATPWEYPATSVVAGWGRFPMLVEHLLCWWREDPLRSSLRFWGLSPRQGVSLQHGAVLIPEGTENQHCLQEGSKWATAVLKLLQITYLGNKNKGLQAQTWACRGRVPRPSACPCLPPSLEHSASGSASSLAPGPWCVRGGTGPGVAELAGASKPHWFVQNRTLQRARQISLPCTAVHHSHQAESGSSSKD